jgi:hypothetical protein
MSGMLFKTDQLRDAVFSLTMVNDSLAKVFQDHLYWKWVFIALHNALQGFMVTALCPFNDYAVMQGRRIVRFECPTCGQWTDVVEKRWGSVEEWQVFCLDSSNNPQPNPPRLLPFMELYERVKKPFYMERLVGARAFHPSGTQTQSVKRLNNELRNDFTHFMPMTKRRFVNDFLPVVKDVTGIILFLAFDSDNIDWVGRDDPRSRTKSLITIISANIAELKEICAARATQEDTPDPELEEWVAELQKRSEETAEQ